VPPRRPESVVVLTGGVPVAASLRRRLGAIDYVIAADSGLYAAQRLDLRVDLLVGDLDSVDEADIADARFEIDRHPRAKDHTDIALALDHAHALHPRRVVVVSGGGGRLDHAFANLLVLASSAYADIQVDAFIGDARVAVIHTRRDLSGPENGLISLFAVAGPARGVTTTGLRYALNDDVLEPLSSRGVSNEFVGGPATVSVAAGVLLSIQPGEEST
jgi:thiamine pyrophosphokinase